MDAALPLLRELAALIAAILGPEGRVSRGAQIRALRLLRPAEALARRLIVLMAWRMGPLARDGSTSLTMRADVAKSLHGERSRTTQGSVPIHFQLFEPLVTFNRLIANRTRAERPKGPGPRILFLDQPYPVASTPEPGIPGEPLRRRLAALEKVLANPAHRARRHARFLARKARRNAPLGRVNPVRPGHAPGARSRHTPPDLKDLLSFLHIEARAGPPRALLGLGPTPTFPESEGVQTSATIAPSL